MSTSKYNKEWAAQYYLDNKEHIKSRNAKWRAANKDRMAVLQKRYKTVDNPTYVAYAERRFGHGLWISAKHNAANQNLEFNIEDDDIIIPTHCPYLGTPITKIYGGGHLATNASIDRIDPSKGYIKGNVQIISRKANRMKNNANIEELKEFARNVLKHHPD